MKKIALLVGMKEIILRVFIYTAAVVGSTMIWWWIFKTLIKIARPWVYCGCIMLMLAQSAAAEVPLNWVRIDGSGAIGYNQHLTLTGDLNRQIKKALPFGIGIVAFWDYDTGPIAYSEYESSEVFFHWQSRFTSDGLFKKQKQITVAIAPPLFRNGTGYAAGLASGRLALAFCGWDYTQCLEATLHEFLHTIGARHLMRANQVMAPDALKYGPAALRIAKRTAIQVLRFLDREQLLESYKRNW